MQLQSDILKIFKAWLGHTITWTHFREEDSGHIIIGTLEQHKVLLLKLKSDKGRDTRAELLVRNSNAYHWCYVHHFYCAFSLLHSFKSIHVLALVAAPWGVSSHQV